MIPASHSSWKMNVSYLRADDEGLKSETALSRSTIHRKVWVYEWHPIEVVITFHSVGQEGIAFLVDLHPGLVQNLTNVVTYRI